MNSSRSCGRVPQRIGAVVAATILPAFAEDINLGPIFTRDTTLLGEKRVRIFGPLFEERVSADGRTVCSVRPLFTRSIEADGRDNCTYLLWPLATAKTTGNEVSTRFGLTFYTDFDKTNPMSSWRLWVLPVLLMGRGSNGGNYFGVFPIGGKASDLLLFDRADFFLFPLYLRTVRGHETTTDVVWPLISSSTGEGRSRMRVFPFYGQSVQEGVSRSMFLLWPILSWSRCVKPGQEGGGFVLFPLIGRIYSPNSKSWLLFPPFFRWTEGAKFKEANFPWPFAQTSSGRINKFYLWPLVGAKSEPGMRDGFVMWPFVRCQEREIKGEMRGHLSILPFLQYDVRKKIVDGKKADGTETISKSMKLWPLWSRRSEGRTSILHVPALWPARDIEPISNTYAPIWTLFSRVDTPDSSDSELLWGLIRRRKGPTSASSSIFPLVSWNRSDAAQGETQEWSFLLGLIGYRKSGNHGNLRLLFMNVGGSRSADLESVNAGLPAQN
jgi:hypothetical protein